MAGSVYRLAGAGGGASEGFGGGVTHFIVPAVGALSSTGSDDRLAGELSYSPPAVCPDRAKCGRIQNCWAVARLAARADSRPMDRKHPTRTQPAVSLRDDN
jgi:hypothetical protein